MPYYRRIRYLDDLVDKPGPARRARGRDRVPVAAPAESVGAGRDRKTGNTSTSIREDKDFSFSVGLVNRFTRHWTGRIDVQRRERDSSAVGRSYDENAVIVTLSYLR